MPPSRPKPLATTPRAPATTTAAESKNAVQSLAKGFGVLEAISGGVDEMTLSEIADIAGLDSGTTFRMVNTLVNLAYLAPMAGSRRFRPTLKVLDLAFPALARQHV